MENLSKLPERLKELMFYREQIKPEELASRIGVCGSTVREWLNGTCLITLKNALLLADFFQCSLNYLAGMTENYETVVPKPLPPFYTHLRFVMDEKKISRYRIVKDTCLHDVYFTRWSKGADPELISVVRIADYLQVSLDYLVGRRDY